MRIVPRIKRVIKHVLRRFKRVSFLFTKNMMLLYASLFILFVGIFFVWASTLKLPDIESFEERRVDVSTKIYDRTGKILLYDLNQNTRRTVVASNQISRYVKNATVAIEDSEFYDHHGVRPLSFARAIIVNLTTGGFTQGGSTITQQVVKNALLTKDKLISRKVKEWVLAINLERIMTKEDILNIYLNENPYGGNIYGIEEASMAFFGKTSADVTLGEAATLAALPQAPTYYSPYGNHREALMNRKNLVLRKMYEEDMISESEYEAAKAEVITFIPQENISIKAPHFVMYIKEYLEEKYGAEELVRRGFNIVTTLDFELQKKGEEIVKQYALENEKKFNAENASLVAIDPKTGQILTMIGSRDYFDKDIEGNFNVATAHRQPGSSFKPFVYASLFNKGYLPETVVYDVKTEFSTACNPDGTPKSPTANCYMPQNYDDVFVGPISLRNALAQSRNIPAIKVLYLTGIGNALRLAKDMGITSLKSANDYGLTLVLGGGEVSPLDMAGAYGVFANEGIKNKPASILKITDREGNVIEEYKPEPTRVLEENVALMINDVLSDNNARIPAYGAYSALYLPGYDVAAKTGTTNDFRDTWIVGYSPTIAVAAWAGNNDNTPIEKKVAGLVVAPMWNAFMKEALQIVPKENFKKPIPPDSSSYPAMVRGEINAQDPHEILYYIDKENPTIPRSNDPYSDSQFEQWEYPVRLWAISQGITPSSSTSTIIFDAAQRPTSTFGF